MGQCIYIGKDYLWDGYALVLFRVSGPDCPVSGERGGVANGFGSAELLKIKGVGIS